MPVPLRPQNDGPAERATTFMKFADSWIGQGNDATYITNTVNPGTYPASTSSVAFSSWPHPFQ